MPGQTAALTAGSRRNRWPYPTKRKTDHSLTWKEGK